MSPVRIILASASPARFSLLDRAGVRCEVIVSDADEDSVTAGDIATLVTRLAELKGRTVAGRVGDERCLIIAADSLLEFDGSTHGKPADVDASRRLWRRMRGASGVLHTGHWVGLTGPDGLEEFTDVASTRVFFSNLGDAELEAYLATGEPGRVAGSFTLDSLGSAFVDRVEGDPGAVIGLSIPLLRRMVASLGLQWVDLWARRA